MRESAASATALMVALSMLRFGACSGLSSAHTALARTALQRAGAVWQLLGWLAQRAWGRGLLDALEWVFEPGMARHHCERKRWLLARLVEQPLPARWLWIGAGFDATPRVAALSVGTAHIELIECDHPATLDLRREAADAIDLLQPEALREQALRWPQDERLLLSLLAQGKATVVLEGVLMYWEPADLLRMLALLAHLQHPPRLLFSALGQGVDSRWRRIWLHLQHEPFRWRASRDDMLAQLAEHGYRCEANWQGDCFSEFLLDCRFVGKRPIGDASSAARE